MQTKTFKYKENLPNPYKLLESLRSTGYDNYNAIADVTDNSVDAEANNIIINIFTLKNEIVIYIADDGIGMDYNTLDQALKLGSDTIKDFETDLGRFGMGLSTASLSLCKRTEVITKKNGTYYKSFTDLDIIKKENKFVKYLDEADKSDIELFKEYTPKKAESGTLVMLTKCDRIQNPNITNFSNRLKKHFGRIYRKFIEAGKNIIINGEKISAIDPLMLNHPNTRIFSEDSYPIKIMKNDILYEDSIKIKMVILPDFGTTGNRDAGINSLNQGFYVMRNERELFDGNTLDGVFTKDNHLNRFRAELYFNGTLDDLLGVHFTKRSISIDQGLKDKIKEYTKGQITQIQKIADSERPKSEKNISHDDSVRLISKKSKLLVKPKSNSEDEKKESRKGHKKNEQVTEKDSDNSISNKLTSICMFEEESMTELGPIFDAYLRGRKVIIVWNSDHPFYKLLIDKKEDKTFVTALDFLVYSLASAELTMITDENTQLIQNIRQQTSQNLRVLLG